MYYLRSDLLLLSSVVRANDLKSLCLVFVMYDKFCSSVLQLNIWDFYLDLNIGFAYLG